MAIEWDQYPIHAGGSGTGLTGAYYYYNNLTALMYTKVDPTVNFNWGTGSPTSLPRRSRSDGVFSGAEGRGLPADNFSVRWTGKVKPRFSGTYTFYVNSDDGARLWVDGQQIINAWTNGASEKTSTTLALTAGVWYSVKLEYYENTGSAFVELK